MTHYNDIYDPMLDALDEDEQKFRTCAFKFLYQFFDEINDDGSFGGGFTNVKSTPERRKLAEEFLKDDLMMDAYTNELYSHWMYEEHPEEDWGKPNTAPWWAVGTSFEGIEDVFPRHFMELISALLPELRPLFYARFAEERIK